MVVVVNYYLKKRFFPKKYRIHSNDDKRSALQFLMNGTEQCDVTS
jgi:hypothetical protein